MSVRRFCARYKNIRYYFYGTDVGVVHSI